MAGCMSRRHFEILDPTELGMAFLPAAGGWQGENPAPDIQGNQEKFQVRAPV
jgi:hypothetical protein